MSQGALCKLQFTLRVESSMADGIRIKVELQPPEGAFNVPKNTL
jgi:hypothetical protein